MRRDHSVTGTRLNTFPKVAYVNDETAPGFKRRVVSALQGGGEAAIEGS